MSMEPEAGLQRLTDEIQRARRLLVTAVRADPERWWSANELEHTLHERVPSMILMIALYDLVTQDAFEIDARLRVRLAA
jgi:hypothetical protein